MTPKRARRCSATSCYPLPGRSRRIAAFKAYYSAQGGDPPRVEANERVYDGPAQSRDAGRSEPVCDSGEWGFDARAGSRAQSNDGYGADPDPFGGDPRKRALRPNCDWLMLTRKLLKSRRQLGCNPRCLLHVATGRFAQHSGRSPRRSESSPSHPSADWFVLGSFGVMAQSKSDVSQHLCYSTWRVRRTMAGTRKLAAISGRGYRWL